MDTTPSPMCLQELLSRTLVPTSQSYPDLTIRRKRAMSFRLKMSWVDSFASLPAAITKTTREDPGIHLQREVGDSRCLLVGKRGTGPHPRGPGSGVVSDWLNGRDYRRRSPSPPPPAPKG